MSHLYLVDDAEELSFAPGSELELTGAEAHHAVTVSRIRPGEVVLIGNGRGVRAQAEVVSVEKASCTCRILSVTRAEQPRPAFVLIQSLAKGDRAELAIEAATELGVDEIIPYQAVRSVARWDGEKRERGRARWQKIVREAAKQSLRHTVPTVSSVLGPEELRQYCSSRLVMVLDPEANAQLSTVDVGSLAEVTEVALIVGPEGGFDAAELDALIAAGALPHRLGTTVLRTSTAGLAALSILNARLGRW